MTPDQERIERLEWALLELVSYREGPYLRKGWYTAIHCQALVDDIIGDLLDKYKPS